MKNKTLKAFKFGILLFGATVLLINCQKNDTPSSLENVLDTNSSIQAEWLGVDELPSKVIQAISGSSHSNTAFNKQPSSSFKLITTDSVVRTIDSLNFKKYSFKSTVSYGTDNFYFENYIVALDPNDNIATYTIRYSPEKDWFFQNGTENLINFTGNIDYYKDDGSLFWQIELINGKVNSDISNSKTSLSAKLVIGEISVFITYEDCHCHSSHASGGCTHPIIVINVTGGGSPNIPYYSGGGSGDEGNPSGFNFGGGSTPVNSMTLKETYIWYINECLSTNQSLESFLSTLQISKLRNLKNFLQANNCSAKAKSFGAIALEAMDNDGVDDGDVDFEDNIIYDNSLSNFPCQKLVMKEAIGTCSPLTQLILDIFETNDGTNLILKSSNTLSNVNANTSSTSNYNATTHTCDITITFRESYLQTATDIAIARTAIHESLHATLVYMFEENLLQSTNGTPMSGFEDFVEAYVNHLSGLSVNLNKAHHELMADFIEDIASSLSVYGTSNGHSNSFDFYKKISWSGDILKTPTYQSLYPEYLNPADATTNPSNVNPTHLDIVNTSAAEENNTTYEYVHPNGITYINSPKGTTPNTTEPCN